MNAEPLSVRWLIQRDMTEALELGAMTPWDEGDLLEHCKLRNSIAMVCEDEDQQIVGWMAYEIHRSSLHIVNVGCDDFELSPAYELMQRLLNKLGTRRDLITANCPDDQDDILVYFRDCGFITFMQHGGVISLKYELPIEQQLCSIGGVTCRRSTGFPCMVPAHMEELK